jgi:hypothetical protein
MKPGHLFSLWAGGFGPYDATDTSPSGSGLRDGKATMNKSLSGSGLREAEAVGNTSEVIVDQ